VQNWQPAADTPARLRALWDRLREISPLALPADPGMLVVDLARRAAGLVATNAGGVLADVARFFFSLTVMLCALFFLLRDGGRIVGIIRMLLPFSDARRDRLIGQTRDLIIASVGAGLAVAAVQGFIAAMTFALLGFSAPAFWGVMTTFASLLPVVGAAIVWVPAAIWLLATGEIARAIILVAVGVGGIGLVDNVLRPVLMSGRGSANGLVIFIGLLGGIVAFGFIGLVLGPIVLVTAGTLLETGIGSDAEMRNQK
jgi:predicted PurR-regulated permease PerM